MAVYDLPQGIIKTSLEVTQSTPQFKTTSLNKKRRSKDRGIHQLKGKIDFKLTGEREQRRFEAWLLKMRGTLNQFNLVLGNRFSAPTNRLNNVRLDSDAGIGAITLNIGGFTGELWEGDYFTMPNDTKVYMALNDLSSSGGTLNIYPALRVAQLTNTRLTTYDVPIRAMLKTDEQLIVYNEAGLITDYTCDWEEYL